MTYNISNRANPWLSIKQYIEIIIFFSRLFPEGSYACWADMGNEIEIPYYNFFIRYMYVKSFDLACVLEWLSLVKCGLYGTIYSASSMTWPIDLKFEYYILVTDCMI